MKAKADALISNIGCAPLCRRYRFMLPRVIFTGLKLFTAGKWTAGGWLNKSVKSRLSGVFRVRCIHIPFCKCEHEDRNVIVNISRVNVEKYLLLLDFDGWLRSLIHFARMWRSAQVRRLLDSSEALKYAYSWIDCNINTRRIFLLGIKISRKFCFFSLSVFSPKSEYWKIWNREV